MRRATALALITIAIAGCSGGYNSRVDQALEIMNQKVALDAALKPAEAGDFARVGMTLRVPKALSAPKGFSLVVPPPVGFDLASSFESPDLTLHVLGRRKSLQGPPKEGEAAPAPRGAFLADATTVLSTAFGSPPAESPKPITIGRNAFKQLNVQANNKAYQVDYFERHDGADEYDAALIWESPAATKPDAQAIENTMKAFAMGTR